MDIDVKNALDKVRFICTEIEQKDHSGICDIFVQDVYDFIQNISIKNGKARFEYFSKIYFGNKELCAATATVGTRDMPESLKMVRRYSQNGAKAFAAFFTVLGRYYLSSAFDKKDVSIDKITEIIKKISSFIADEEAAQKKTVVIDSIKPRLVPNAEHVAAEKNEQGEETKQIEEPEETLEELLAKLNSLIGLEGVKKEVNQIINLIKVQKKGEEFGEKLPPLSLHLVFYGNPGTGKTTVARLLGKIYKSLGVLSTGQMIEVDRSGLIGQHVGDTEAKTKEVIDKSLGGILFIDEAYALTQGKQESDFGHEAVNKLLKEMEDHRDDFIVIVAGYPDPMKEFIASNPGLKSRFNQFINFEDYTPDELHQIFMLQCNSQGLKLDENCEGFLHSYFERLYSNRSEDYANGRDVRNYFEKVFKARANRLAPDLENVTHEEFMTIKISDLGEAAKSMSTFEKYE